MEDTLNITIQIRCNAEASEDAITPVARSAEFTRRLAALLEHGTIREAFSEAGFDILDAYVSRLR